MSGLMGNDYYAFEDDDNEDEYVPTFKMKESIRCLINWWDKIKTYIIDKGWDVYQDEVVINDDDDYVDI